MQKWMQQKILRIYTGIFLLMALAVTTGASLAWYGEIRRAGVDLAGSVTYVARYFESGDGSQPDEIVTGYDADGSPVFGKKADGTSYTDEEHKAVDTPAAYEIKTPEQLYNLAWLQYLGYFNDQPFYFYLSADLDMTGWVLPPIGTKEYPFLGSFDGNGYTISNLTVSNRADGTDMEAGSGKDSEMPLQVKEELTKDGATDLGEEAEIIGLFGVVGEYTGGSTYSGTISEIKNLRIDGIVIETRTQRSLAGLAAGYVNGTLAEIAVSDGTISNATGAEALDSESMTDKLSDYMLVGYCEDEYKDTLDVATVEMSKPVLMISRADAQASGDAWGGSIDMLSLYNRIEYMESNGTNPTYYATETTVTQADGTSVTAYSNPQIISQYIRNYTDEKAGSATLGAHYSSGWSTMYNYLLGAADFTVSKTYINTTYSHEEVGAVIASDGTHYLNATVTGIETGDSEDTATKWVFSGVDSGTLETYIDDEVYYLSRSGTNLTITADSTSAVTWIRESNRIYTTDGETDYYLKYDETAQCWTLISAAKRSYITDGEHYMVYSGTGDSVTASADSETASKWYVYENADGKYVISTSAGGADYYLYNDGGTLIASGDYTSATATAWIRDDDGRLYSDYTIGGVTTRYYITYDAASGSWVLAAGKSGYVISNGYGTYVTVSSNRSFSTTTDIDSAAWWSVTSASGGYYISTDVNGTEYYLYLASNAYGGNYYVSLTGSQSTSNSIWSAYTYSGATYYYISASSGGGWGRTYYYVLSVGSSGLSYSSNRRLNSAAGDASFEIGSTYAPAEEAAVLTFKAANMPAETLSLISTAAQKPTTTQSTTTASATATIPDTYLPLTAENQAGGYAVKDINTGYIVSGSNYRSSSYWPRSSGDIRVSGYGIDNISASYNKSSRAFTSVYTINDSGIQTIPTSHTFVKYDDSKTSFLETLSGQSYVYGLHFMDASIAKDDAAVIPKAVIDRNEYANYKVPRHCIDFNLREAGYINFFAGEYYSGNKSFFTLHQIIRDEATQEITDIKEIAQVYSTAEAGVYVYLYSDGTYSSSDERVDKVFDMEWIGYNDAISYGSKRVFYFEIPANAGEYALGSVSGSSGGYLMYLDLSTNAQELRKQELTEITTVTKDTYGYPKGVQLVAAGGGYTSDSDSACAGMTAGSVASASISRSGDRAVLTVSSTGIGTGAFVGDGIVLEDSNGNELTMTATATSKDETEKVTVYTYNCTTKETTFTVTTTKESTDNAGSVTRTAERYIYSDWEADEGTQDTDFEDDGHDIATAETIIRYHYYDENGANVSIAFHPTLLTNGGISSIQDEDYPAMGADPIDKSSELSEYTIRAASDKAITIRGDEVVSPYSATINDTELSEGASIEVPAA